MGKTALDEIYANERKKAVQWIPAFLPTESQTIENAFANHTPMAAEAMSTLGIDGDVITAWASTWTKSAPADYDNVPPIKDWKLSLGDYTAVGAYAAAVDLDIARLGWQEALKLWCGRLLPGLGTHMFHGMLRVSHAVRALRVAGNEANVVRCRELSLAIAVWASRWRASKPALGDDSPKGAESNVEARLLAHAARGASAYVEAGGGIMNGIDKLHCVTGPMAFLDMLMPELDRAHHLEALAAFEQTHKELLGNYQPSVVLPSIGFPDLAELRSNPLEWAQTGEQLQHVVKLCDACLRAYNRSNDPVFAHCALKALQKPIKAAL